jgi:acyl-CoA thioester hydrolase
MSNWRQTLRGMVFPWHCDQFGHMNVRWYAHFFDDAGFHIWPMIGVKQAQFDHCGLHTVIAQTKTDFVFEITAGTPIVIESGFTRIGTKSLSHAQRMYHADTGQIHARQATAEVFFDPKTRKSVSIPEPIKAIVADHLVDPEDPPSFRP